MNRGNQSTSLRNILVPYTRRSACHGRTASILIRGRDGVGGRDTGDSTSRRHLALILQGLGQLLFHSLIVENPPSGSTTGRSRSAGRCTVVIVIVIIVISTAAAAAATAAVVPAAAAAAATSSSATPTTVTTACTASSQTSGITGGRGGVLTRCASRFFGTLRGSCRRLFPFGRTTLYR